MSARKQFFCTFGLLGILLVACVVVNYIGNQRLAQPVVFDVRGRNSDTYRSIMLRSNDYDAIIGGSSMSTNFRCSEFDASMDAHSIKIAKNGTTMPGFCVVCQYALSLKPVKYVLVDLGMMQDVPPEQTCVNEKLYTREFSFGAFLKECFSIENTMRALRFCCRPPKEIPRDDYNIWYKKNSREEAIRSLPHDVLTSDGQLLPLSENFSCTMRERIATVIDKTFLPLINKFSDTTFIIYFPPYSLLYFYMQKPEQVIAHRRMLYTKLLSCKNVILLDFQTASEITEELRNYKDRTHYLEDINSWIIDQLSSDTYRVTQQNADELLKKLECQIKDYDFSNAPSRLKAACPDWQIRKKE